MYLKKCIILFLIIDEMIYHHYFKPEFEAIIVRFRLFQKTSSFYSFFLKKSLQSH